MSGRGARAWLDRVFACRIPQPGRLRLAPMLNPAGRIVGDLSMACLAQDRFMIVGSGFAEEFHLRWLHAAAPPPDVCVRSSASTLCGVSIAGPRARELVQQLTRLDLSAGAFKLFQVAETAVGFAPAILTRAGFTGELGYEIWTTPDYFASLYDGPVAGRRRVRAHPLRRPRAVVAAPGEGLRLVQQGLPSRLHARRNRARPLHRLRQAGLHRPRRAALAERAAGARRRFVIMEVADTDVEVVGYESILKDGAAVGYVTSGAYGHCIERSLAAGYVPAALAQDGARFEIDILGELRQATVRLEPLYDPQGLRLRS